MPEYLCESGIKFYNQGKYSEASGEFKKALLINPDYAPALKYMQILSNMGFEEEESVVLPANYAPGASSSFEAAEEYLDIMELQNEVVKERKQTLTAESASYLPSIPVSELLPEAKSGQKVKILFLNESLAAMLQPIEVAIGDSVVLTGENISRFLITQPDMFSVEKKDDDNIILTAIGLGVTYVHVWDNNGRWTTEWVGVIPKPTGSIIYDERMRRGEEIGNNFKLNFNMDWNSFQQGRRVSTLGRQTYNYTYRLGLTGPTPYANIDSAFTVRRSPLTTDLTYLTIGFKNIAIGDLKDINVRGFDYSPDFINMAFPGASLRGGILNAMAFNKKVNYTAFWGQEGGGRYGNLSPGLSKMDKSYVEGVNVNYTPTITQAYQGTLVHGWGRDRESYLSRYDYDLSAKYNFTNWSTGYEIANDTERFAQIFSYNFKGMKRFGFSAEFRDISTNFNSILGRGWRQGEFGGLINFNFSPFDKFSLGGNVNIYQDRSAPASEREQRYNEDANINATYQVDSKTMTSVGYNLQNDLGRVSQTRYQNVVAGINRTDKLFDRDFSIYGYVYHQENKNYSSPPQDYINDKLYAGLRFNVIGHLYYYMNAEMNFLSERYYSTWAHPKSMETGLDWSRRINNSPFYGTLRYTYHDEEDAQSIISLLSGEDYSEGYAELTYRPDTGNAEFYMNGRVRNVWAEVPTAQKRVEADLNAGMRYVWDTGLHWDSMGDIDGYVFKDYNSDGLRNRDDPPIEGIKVWLGKDKSAVTDIFGYYRFRKIKARKAFITLDTASLPQGYVLTVPVSQEVAILQGRTARVDFGMISRSEISGTVFEDINKDGEFSRGDKSVQGVTVTLEDGSTATSDPLGRYLFTNVRVGEHTLTLDLNSVPIIYLPETSVTKKIALFEGATYINNIPLKRVEGN